MSVRHTLPARLPRPLGRIGWALVTVGVVIAAGILLLTRWASDADARAHQADESLASLAGPVAQACAHGGLAAEEIGPDACVQAVMARRAQTRAPLDGRLPTALPPTPGVAPPPVPPLPSTSTVYLPGPTVTRTVEVPGPTLVVPPSTTLPPIVESTITTTSTPPSSTTSAPPPPTDDPSSSAPEPPASSAPAASDPPASPTPAEQPPEQPPEQPGPIDNLLNLVGL